MGNLKLAPDHSQPAFPNAGVTNDGWSENGMTLRDYFAAKAMQGIISALEFEYMNDDALAKSAYRVADAMLEAREK